jgi:hypothetical protein
MIRHIVLFTLRRPDALEAALAGLRRLAESPHVHALEVMPNLKRDRFDTSVDVVVHGLFRDEAALAAFQADPIYAEAVATVRPLRETRMAADFVTGLP